MCKTFYLFFNFIFLHGNLTLVIKLACEVAQQVKVFAVKLDDLRLMPRTQIKKERTNS